MALSRRYQPNWPPGEVTYVGMDFADVVPPGTAILSAELIIVINQSPVIPTTDFTQSAIELDGRQVWCQISGGQQGTDYQFRWTVNDNRANAWSRTALLMCAETS